MLAKFVNCVTRPNCSCTQLSTIICAGRSDTSIPLAVSLVGCFILELQSKVEVSRNNQNPANFAMELEDTSSPLPTSTYNHNMVNGQVSLITGLDWSVLDSNLKISFMQYHLFLKEGFRFSQITACNSMCCYIIASGELCLTRSSDFMYCIMF